MCNQLLLLVGFESELHPVTHSLSHRLKVKWHSWLSGYSYVVVEDKEQKQDESGDVEKTMEIVFTLNTRGLCGR